MTWTQIISKYSIWIGLLLVGGFSIWKFILEPKINEGEPIEEDQE